MSELDEVLQEFLVESYENLDQLEQDMVSLEENPQETDIIASIFRTIHTIKGTCGFLGFGKLEKVTHTGENLLSLLRDGHWAVNRPITDTLLHMGDAVREMLGHIESTQTEGDTDYSALIAELERLQKTGGLEDGAEDADAATDVQTEDVTDGTEAPDETGADDACDDHAGTADADPAVDQVHAATVQVSKAAPTNESQAPSEQAQARADAAARSATEQAIRVDVGLLDKLMNLVGELVLARNQILQYGAQVQNPVFASTTQRLNVLTSELQENVMKTRMQPIGNIWNKLPRVVRDLANSCGKKIRLEMEGKDTELDKTLIEAIKDPLTHLVRNAVDHGVEDCETRRANGKPAEGVLLLRAFHEGGLVNIEIADDGGGIDTGAIAAKAVRNGLITEDQAEAMSEREVANLIFKAGLSTAKQVTNVSGRGVGMDVVRTNIEKIGGTIEIQTRAGQGTTFRIKIPLTLAIIPAQIVAAAQNRFAIPQVSLIELLRLEGDVARNGIELIHGTPVYRLRGNLLPLVYLNRELGLPEAELDPDDPIVNIVVLQADERDFGLVVDSINDTEEIVVKPLGSEIKNLATYAGATIMGDGAVALILDVIGVAQGAGVLSEIREHGAALQDDGADDAGERKTLLLFTVGEGSRLGMPLEMVARLEEFEPERVEQAGTQQVVQYRDELLPLIPVSNVLGGYAPRPREADEKLQVVVYTKNDRSVGLLVDDIVDIVHENITVKRESDRPGLLGSAVIQGRVTDLVDAEGVIRAADPSFFTQQETAIA
ncbi:MAG TPA: chemotaxis protein CheW [Candidatus Krumholzibacteria bacterium]|nr:chemotaxis protein CheW [Candidatus Krumholzibacteria bacterium]